MERIEQVVDLVEHHMSVRMLEDFRLEVRIRTKNLTALDALRQMLGKGRSVEKRWSSFRWRCQNAEDLLFLFKAVSPYLQEQKELVETCIEFLTATEPAVLWNAAVRLSTLLAQG